jgi:AraC-like DNA-binding protein/mannose-6-phosphate isomerase-like protein (cupin superfamily)
MDFKVEIDYQQAQGWDYLAHILDQIRISTLSRACGRVQCEPGWSWQPRLRDFDLWLAVEGRGELSIAGQHYSIHAGDLFFLRPGDTGWATQDLNHRLRVLFLHFDLEAPAHAEHGWLPQRHIHFQDLLLIEPQLYQAIRLIEGNQPLAQTEARHVIQQCLVTIYRQAAANYGWHVPQHDARIEQIVNQLRSQPERRLALEEAAEQVGLAPAYFSRLFSQETGMNFRSFALHARLARARTLLEETNMPIGLIAQALGYEDVYLFSRQCKQHYGLSPLQVRNRRQ